VGLKRIIGLSASEVAQLLTGPAGTEIVIKATRADAGKKQPPTKSGGGGVAGAANSGDSEYEVVLCRGGRALQASEHADELSAMLLRVPDAVEIVRALYTDKHELEASLRSAQKEPCITHKQPHIRNKTHLLTRAGRSALKEDLAQAEEAWGAEFASIRAKLEGEGAQLRAQLQQALAAHARTNAQHVEHVAALEAALTGLASYRSQAVRLVCGGKGRECRGGCRGWDEDGRGGVGRSARV